MQVNFTKFKVCSAAARARATRIGLSDDSQRDKLSQFIHNTNKHVTKNCFLLSESLLTMMLIHPSSQVHRLLIASVDSSCTCAQNDF